MNILDYAILAQVKKKGNGGGSGVNVQPLDVTENGTYTAPEGVAYSPVNVNVQGGGGEASAIIKPLTITENGTYSAKSGKIEYGVEVKFKEVMTEADFESYVAKATPIFEAPEGTQYALFGEWTVMFAPAGEVNIYAVVNMSLKIGYYVNISAMMPDSADGWMNTETMVAIDYIPSTIIPEGTQMSADLETSAIFFELEKIDAYAPVTVNVVKKALEPISVSAVTGQLMFKIEDPNGDLTTEYELYESDDIQGEFTYVGTFPKSKLNDAGEFYIKGIGIAGIDTNKCYALKAKATSELEIAGYPMIL